MKTKTNLLAAGILLTTTLAAFSQPTISSLRLSGQAATPLDTSHLYVSNSVSPGANLIFKVTAGGTAPRHYQWQFNLRDIPGQTNVSLVLTNVQLTDAGDYTVVVTNAAGATNRTATLQVDPTFTKITTGPVVTDAGFSTGGTWADYNKDGFLDLFVFNGDFSGNTFNPFLYRNNTNGTFSKVTSGSPVNFPAESYSACFGDYDNDGNLDLYLATASQNLLYHNNGNGTFTRIATGKVVTDNASTYGASWADYDNDGLLDLFVTTFNLSGSAHNFLYRNNGEGTFSSITNSILVTEGASSLGCVWGDYDNDGKIDLFVCGGTGHDGGVARPNRLYHNNGDGTFTKVTTGSIATDVGYAGPAAWGDYDNDGFLDLFVPNINIAGLKHFLYHNNGDGTFTSITNSVLNDTADLPYGCAWGDYDNDGFLDLFVTDRDYSKPIPVNFLYHNNGDGTFTKITTGSLVNEYSDSWGCAWADYDNDGFLDLFASRGNQRGNYLYRNNGNSNSWVTVKLTGTASNRAAIGAKVGVTATIGGVSRSQLRQITGGSGWTGHNELVANFGLGDATNLDLVRIEWPSGIVQTMTNAAMNKILTLEEHQSGAVTTPSFTSVARSAIGIVDLSVTGDTGYLYLFEGSTNLVNWNWLGVRSNTTGTIQFTDPKATNYATRFYRVSIP